LNIGSFVIAKQRPREPLAYIHSKPVVYTNNGGGRDTYISDSSGGLRTIYQPAYQKRTFYNELRQYPKIDNYGRRGKSHTATFEERNDTFSKSQDHWNSGFRREMTLLGNYQRMLDHRLSKPKSICKVPREYKDDRSIRIRPSMTSKCTRASSRASAPIERLRMTRSAASTRRPTVI